MEGFQGPRITALSPQNVLNVCSGRELCFFLQSASQIPFSMSQNITENCHKVGRLLLTKYNRVLLLLPPPSPLLLQYWRIENWVGCALTLSKIHIFFYHHHQKVKTGETALI